MTNVLVFDLDDTLYPEHQFVMSGFRFVDGWLNKQKKISGFFEKAKSLFDKGKRGNIFNLFFDERGIQYDQGLINTLIEIYRNHPPKLQIFKDARWALNYFKEKKLGLITDGFFKSQKNKIIALGIENFFITIVYTDEYGRKYWKPSKFSYEKIMKVTSEDGKNCTYIGDNPLKDFITAKKLGWKTVQICRNGGEYNDVLVADEFKAGINVNSLYELKNIIC